MPQVLGWFPGATFANLFLAVVVAVAIIDQLLPRAVGGRDYSLGDTADRGTFLGIQIASTIGLALAVWLRIARIGLVPDWAQWIALALVVLGAAIRFVAIAELGKYFSRTLRLERGHRLISSGLHSRIRHPAYTGMLILNPALVLGIGSGVGALAAFLLLLLATVWRIRGEERLLLKAFPLEYSDYVRRTWRLIPGW